MLILAGVSIAMLTGENGILTQAQTAKERTEKENLIEQVRVDILGKQTEKEGKNLNKSELKEILEKYFDNVPEELPDNLESLELTSKEEYGSQTIKASEIYTGSFEEEQELIEIVRGTSSPFEDVKKLYLK